MNRKIMVGLAVLLAIPLIGNAQVTASKYAKADSSCPIIIKYIGSSTNLCSINSDTNVILVADGLVNTKLLGGSTVNDIIGWINTLTNETGNLVFKAACWEALTADYVTNKFIQVTNQVVSASWDQSVFKWDTSIHSNYNVICDIPNSAGYAAGGYFLKSIYGDPTGTGNVTLNVYADDTMVYQKTFTSPFYVVTSVGTTNTTADNTITLESANFPGIWIGAGKRGLVRANRATTTTTGGIGVSVDARR